MTANFVSHFRVGFDASPAVSGKAELTGYVTKLMAGTARGGQRKVSTLLRMVQPAIQQRRVQVFFNEDGSAVGYVIWALLVPEVEDRVLAQGDFNLHESEWNEGERLWIVDLVAPHGNLRHILRDLKERAFAGAPQVRYLRTRGTLTQGKLLRRDGHVSFFRSPHATAPALLAPRLPVLQVFTAAGRTLMGAAQPLLDDPFSAEGDADLAQLAACIGTARMVVLGSQTHGDGNGLAMKARIVRYLCRHKGFRVLAVESGSYDIERAGAMVDAGTASYRESLRGAMFYMYAEAGQLQDFFDFLEGERQRPDGLRLRGFHSKHTGRFALADLCEDLRQFLAAAGADPLADDEWRELNSIVRDVIRMSTERPEPALLAWYEDRLRRLHTAIAPLPDLGEHPLESSAYWKRVLTELEKQGQRYWKIHDDWAMRERSLADYLLWMSARFHADEKIIVWTHNIHAIRHPKAFKMGARLAAALGEQLVCVGFTGDQGRFVDWVSGGVQDISPASPDSMEHLLGQSGQGASWLDLRKADTQAALGGARPWRYRNYTDADFPVTGSFDVIVSHRRVDPTLREEAAS